MEWENIQSRQSSLDNPTCMMLQIIFNLLASLFGLQSKQIIFSWLLPQLCMNLIACCPLWTVCKIVRWSLYLYLDFCDMEAYQAYQTNQLLNVTTNKKNTDLRCRHRINHAYQQNYIYATDIKLEICFVVVVNLCWQFLMHRTWLEIS